MRAMVWSVFPSPLVKKDESARAAEAKKGRRTNISSARIAPVPSTFRRAITHSYINYDIDESVQTSV